METGAVAVVFDRMRHPYTQALFRSIPLPGAHKNARPLVAIPGNFPLPHERPPGCYFGPRCSYFVAGRCDAQRVDMARVDAGHDSRCLRVGEIAWNAPPPRQERALPTRIGAPILTVDRLRKYYQVSTGALFNRVRRLVKANEAVSFEARRAEILAIVGESGCGKSTLAKILMGLETATAGEATLNGQAIGKLPVQQRSGKTVSSIQMVFQNPFDTLNPSMRVADRKTRMLELLDLVRLPREFAARVPRQLSGGQKQRIGVARAFAGTPAVVVADEPVSALDVSVQAAITELLMDIQRTSGTTMLFISHDLSVVRYLSDRVVVMYLGHIVEMGPTEDVFAPPYHPYTEALLSAVPIADTSVKKKRILLEGEIPSAISPPPGCPFQTRCRWKQRVPGNRCETELPPMVELRDGHFIKCHLAQDVLVEMEPVITLEAVHDAEIRATSHP